DVVIYIPDFELRTEDARNVLPQSFLRQDAAAASSVSNLMISALMTGDYRLAGQMMESDLFHESYRATLIPNYADIKSNARKLGDYCTVISGARPTMSPSLADKEGPAIAISMLSLLPNYEVEAIGIDQHGLTINN